MHAGEQTEPRDVSKLHPIGDDIDLLCRAVELVVQHNLASRSMIHRRLQTPYEKAGHLLELMEERNLIEPAFGSAVTREVRVSPHKLPEVLTELRRQAGAETVLDEEPDFSDALAPHDIAYLLGWVADAQRKPDNTRARRLVKRLLAERDMLRRFYLRTAVTEET